MMEVKISTFAARSGGAQFAGTVTDAVPLEAGSTITATVRKPNGETATTSIAIPGQPPPPSGDAIYAAAPFAALTKPMTIRTNATASGGQCIGSDVVNAGTATFSLAIFVTGTYYAWARVLAPNSGKDSFFVQMDGSAEDVFDCAEGTASPNWQWTRLNGRGSSGVPLSVNPRTFSLSAGAHSLRFRGREPGCLLDRIALSRDAAFRPADAPAPTPPPVPPPTPPPPTPPPVPPPTGTARYAAPNGSASGSGTQASPWSLAAAVQNGRVRAGETLYLRGGTYKTTAAGPVGQEVTLAGVQGNPVHIKAYPGERVIIDGGLRVVAPAADLWIWDLEVIVSEPRAPVNEASTDEPKRPWGGLNLDAGPRCKAINLILHDNCQGASFWKGATDSEIHGCLIFDNGWNFKDVNGNPNSTGYAIYSQNESGWKTISDNFLLDTYAWSFHIYGEQSASDNYLIEGNVIALPERDDICLFGGTKPVRNLRVLGNWFVNSKTWIGYDGSKSNVNCEVRDNVTVGGYFNIKPNWQSVAQSGNVILEPGTFNVPRVLLRPNKYDLKRAHLAVMGTGSTVSVNAGAFLKSGDRYRLLNPRNFYGAAVLSGTYSGSLNVPVTGGFGAFVLMKE